MNKTKKLISVLLVFAMLFTSFTNVGIAMTINNESGQADVLELPVTNTMEIPSIMEDPKKDLYNDPLDGMTDSIPEDTYKPLEESIYDLPLKEDELYKGRVIDEVYESVYDIKDKDKDKPEILVKYKDISKAEQVRQDIDIRIKSEKNLFTQKISTESTDIGESNIKPIVEKSTELFTVRETYTDIGIELLDVEESNFLTVTLSILIPIPMTDLVINYLIYQQKMLLQVVLLQISMNTIMQAGL